MDSTRERDDADRLLRPCEAATLRGVTAKTLRRWNDKGLLGAEKTPAGHRRYWYSEVRALAGVAA